MQGTIKSKLISIGIVALLGQTILAGSMLFVSSVLKDSIAFAELHGKHLSSVQEMRREILTIMLGAMDSIIDKDDGKIQPDRMQAMNHGLEVLETGVVSLKGIADTDEEAKLASELVGAVANLKKGITVNLVKAIEGHAGEEAFAEIDDILDQSGDGIQAKLAAYEESLNRELAEAKDQQETWISRQSLISILTYVITTILMVVGLFITGGSIIKPIHGLTDAMRRLAAGDRQTPVPALAQKDEIGEMARTVDVFKQNAIEMDRLKAEQETSQREAAKQRRASMEQLTDSFNGTVGGILKQVLTSSQDLETTAKTMSSTADETMRQSTAVAAASQEASTNVQTVAAAAEELAASIQEISRQVAQSTKVAQGASEEAAKANTMVHGLAEAAGRIGEVVNLINDIASQTNLLALNATIEAARAGDAGKGFAVVANEVKSLANQTAKATEEIGQQIGAVQSATQDAVSAIEGIGRVIAEVNQISTAIASAVEEQGAATHEIARNVQQASAATAEVNSHIQGVSQGAEKTGGSAGHVLTSAGALNRQALELRGQVDGFLSRVQAG